MRFVIDASVALRWFIEEERDDAADAVYRRAIDAPSDFAVPELFGCEVFSVLHRIHPRPWETFEAGILPLLSCGVLRYPLTESIARRASRFIGVGLRGFDAMYVALAEELGALWLTFDAKAHHAIAAEHLSADISRGLPEGW